MKKLLSIALLALGLGSSTQTKANSSVYVGATVGWTNISQSVDSLFEANLLNESDFEFNNEVKTPAEYNQALPANQTFYTQNLGNMTAASATSRAAGSVFGAWECVNDKQVMNLQIEYRWIAGNAQQVYNYDVVEQSVVGTLDDPTLSVAGTKYEPTPAGGTPTDNNKHLVHTVNYNGVNVKNNTLEIKAHSGLNIMAGYGFKLNDTFSFLVNAGWAIEWSKATLNYYEGDLAFAADEDGAPSEASTEKKFARNGFLCGVQLIWTVAGNLEALAIYNCAFFGKKTIEFDDFGSSDDEDSSDIMATQVLYADRHFKANSEGKTDGFDKTEENGSAETFVEGNEVKSSLQRHYFGLGLRYKFSSGE